MLADRSTFEAMLRNEADMAAKRRIQTVLQYLDLREGERVLDCGCGLGWMTKFLDELYECDVFALDIDLARVRRARRELRPRVRLTVGDVAHLPYPDDAFDKIALSEVLEHVPNDREALREVRRVLKPGGVVAITVPNHNYPLLWDPINWIRERAGRAPIRQGVFGGLWTDHQRLYSRQAIVELVQRADLVAEDVRQLVHYCVPFAHNIVYGLGKSLVERGWLAHADRFRFGENSGSWLNPINWGLRLVDAVDRFNDPVSDDGKSTVIISVKGRKLPNPAAP